MTQEPSVGDAGLAIETTCTDDGVLILSVRGELDIFTAPRLAELITNGVDAALGGLIVDLSSLDFLASVGMTVLLDTT